jgi:hypothetical protein
MSIHQQRGLTTVFIPLLQGVSRIPARGLHHARAQPAASHEGAVSCLVRLTARLPRLEGLVL